MTVAVATYEEKVAHIEVVAQRGADARAQAVKSGQKPSKRQARAIFRAMAAQRRSARGTGYFCLVFTDTPEDRGAGVSPAWAKHVRRVFLASFNAGEPKPLPPK
uniref:hypothetical protein n=1 Tax=Amycolatopsis sp. CA-290885 TaxID=3239925 RepID=UPI003F49361D